MHVERIDLFPKLLLLLWPLFLNLVLLIVKHVVVEIIHFLVTAAAALVVRVVLLGNLGLGLNLEVLIGRLRVFVCRSAVRLLVAGDVLVVQRRGNKRGGLFVYVSFVVLVMNS